MVAQTDKFMQKTLCWRAPDQFCKQKENLAKMFESIFCCCCPNIRKINIVKIRLTDTDMNYFWAILAEKLQLHIAQWIRLRLPPHNPGFKSTLFQFTLIVEM